MNLKKIFAGIAAVSVAASALAVGAFAATEKSIKPSTAGALEDYGSGMYFFDIYDVETGNQIVDDITELDGAVAIGIHFQVSDFDNYGAEFDAYVDFWYNDGDDFIGDAEYVDQNGDYTAWVELDDPVVADEDNVGLSLGIFLDEEEGNGGVPKFEVIEILVQLEDDGAADDGTTDDGTNDDGTTDDGTNDDGTTDDGTNDDGAADDGADADNGTGNTNDKTDDDKGNADTGIEGVAMAAGIAALAAGVVVVAKKRK